MSQLITHLTNTNDPPPLSFSQGTAHMLCQNGDTQHCATPKGPLSVPVHTIPAERVRTHTHFLIGIMIPSALSLLLSQPQHRFLTFLWPRPLAKIGPFRTYYFNDSLQEHAGNISLRNGDDVYEHM